MKIFLRILFIALLLTLLFLGYNLLQKRIDKTVTAVLKTTTGLTVPANWVSKAKNLGYYCPSWNAKPGEIVSQICYKLAK